MAQITPIATLSLLLLPLTALADAPSGPSWRVLFNNDTTNILSCQSPYHHGSTATIYKDAPGEKFTDDMVRASVDEAAVQGMDAMALMTGLGRVPWWPSKIDPMAEHEAWFQAHYGVKPHFVIDDYLLAGGDYIKVFVDECHRKGISALIAFRLNDAHGLVHADGGAEPRDAQCVSRFYVEHPGFRLEPKPVSYGMGVHNWLIPEARAYKLSFIAELAEIYDIDGIELDFLRHSKFFPAGTPMAERVAVMAKFVGQVRAILDRTERGGRRRWLGARVGQESSGWMDTGFDPAAYRAAGVDYFNLSNYFNMSQQTSLPEVRRAVPDAAIYLEETQSGGTRAFRRSTAEMLESTARLAYRRGADGISLFNFVYYRHDPAMDGLGPFDEPPFAVLPTLANLPALEKAPGYYFLNPMDRAIQPGAEAAFSLDMAPRPGDGEAWLRLQIVTQEEIRADNDRKGVKFVANAPRGRWRVLLNGLELAPAGNAVGAYPYPTTIKAGFGSAGQYLSWRVPAGAAVDGGNRVKVALLGGPEDLRLRWIEVFSPPPRD